MNQDFRQDQTLFLVDGKIGMIDIVKALYNHSPLQPGGQGNYDPRPMTQEQYLYTMVTLHGINWMAKFSTGDMVETELTTVFGRRIDMPIKYYRSEIWIKNEYNWSNRSEEEWRAMYRSALILATGFKIYPSENS